MILSIIALENIQKEAYLGVYDIEKQEKNTLIINVKMQVDTTLSCLSDNLKDTVDYAEVYRIIDEELEISTNLLEKKGYDIARKIAFLSEKIHTVELKITKKRPIFMDNCEATSVIIFLNRNDMTIS